LGTRKAAFIYSAELEKYRYPSEHPFNTIRAKKTREIVNSLGLLTGDGRSEVPPVPAERLVLKKFHSARYLHALKTAAKGRWDTEALNMGIGTGDCPVFEGLYEYAVLATGATLVAAKLLLSGKTEVAFNPSGGFHHAILYLDVDVHHGDGVAYAFYDRCDVMTISLHQNPRTLFPGTGFEDEIGTGKGKGYCINIPLPVGTYDQEYMKAFEAVALPLMKVYNPDVFVFELGADALAGDPLANLFLTNNVYVEVINHLLNFNKPILTTGGGGYNVDNTARAWALAWTVLCGSDIDNHAVGGVMLESTDWQGGLRDRAFAVSQTQREMVVPVVEATIEAVKANIFPIHKL